MLIGEVAQATIGLGALLKQAINYILGHQVGTKFGAHNQYDDLLRQTSDAVSSVFVTRNT